MPAIQPDNAFIITDVLLFTGDEFIEDGHIVVENGLISSIGAGSAPPSSLPTFSYPNHTVIPGLIDSHTHGLFGNVYCISQPLRFGVTTVCDLHNEPTHIHSLQALSRSSRTLYSDFKCAGTSATISGGWPEPIVLSHGATPQAQSTIASWPNLTHPSQAQPYVDAQITTCSASCIKLMHEVGDCLHIPSSPPAPLPVPSLPLQTALVRAAHARGRIAVGHAFSHAGALDLLRAGVDGLTHIFLDAPPADDAWVELLLRNGAHVNPTLTTAGSQTGEVAGLQAAFEGDAWVGRMLLDRRPRGPLGLGEEGKASWGQAVRNARRAYAAGVPLVVGSDSSGQVRGAQYGLGVHMEMWQMVHRVGMRGEEVLRAATSLIADRFGFGDRGRLRAGLLADLVLLERDVRDVMKDEKNLCLPVTMTWREGHLADAYKESDEDSHE